MRLRIVIVRLLILIFAAKSVFSFVFRNGCCFDGFSGLLNNLTVHDQVHPLYEVTSEG